MAKDGPLRLGFVVQRYGEELGGGAEAYCKALAEHLLACQPDPEDLAWQALGNPSVRQVEVTVFTTCALSAETWANQYPAGTSTLGGVKVERHPTVVPRLRPLRAVLWRLIQAGYRWPALARLLPSSWRQAAERLWVCAEGPWCPTLIKRVAEVSAGFDALFFVTHLFYPSVFGLPRAQTRAVLFPMAHDDHSVRFEVYLDVLEQAPALAFLTPEEATLVGEHARVPATPQAVVGAGLQSSLEGPTGLRPDYASRPYLLYLGRLDREKGLAELCALFAAFKASHGEEVGYDAQGEPYRLADLGLILAGRGDFQPIGRSDVVVAGFVPDEEKRALLAHCELLVQPSRFESLSLVLLEAWAHGKAVLVQGACAPMAGQVERSGGGRSYTSPETFEAGLLGLLGHPAERRAAGEAGRAYVREHYDWQQVAARVLQLAARTPAPPSEGRA